MNIQAPPTGLGQAEEDYLDPPEDPVSILADLTTGAVYGMPESWLCVDCGFNTAPGCFNRAEAGRRGVPMRFDDQSEVYYVGENIWAAAGMRSLSGCLCISCLEKRIGRELRPEDFPDHVFNYAPGTPRLLSRRGIKSHG
jgi:hypothetical protein